MNNYKLQNGNEILLGQDIYGSWTVSCWNEELDCLWNMKFDKQSDAEAQFQRSVNVAKQMEN
jgi:hypothetical protein